MPAEAHQKPLPSRRALFAAIAAAIAILAVDQLSKYLVVVVMNLRETGELHVFPVLTFRMAWNTGVNFGLLSGGGETARYILAAGTSLVSIGLIVGAMFCRRMLSAIGLGLAAGGAIGNAIDRFNWGAVADFINVSCCGIHNPWSFNVADIAIFVGFGLLLLPMFRRPAPEAPSHPS
jgi:signal peptidase II